MVWLCFHSTEFSHMTSVKQFNSILFLNATDYVLSVITHDNMPQYNEIMDDTNSIIFLYLDISVFWAYIMATFAGNIANNRFAMFPCNL